MLLFVTLVVGACADIKLKDFELYWPLPEKIGGGATQTWTISPEIKQIPREEWLAFVENEEVVVMRYTSLAWIRETIEKLCSEHRALCKEEVKKNVEMLMVRTERVRRRDKTK